MRKTQQTVCCSLLISGIKIKGVEVKCEYIFRDIRNRIRFILFHIQFHEIDRSFSQTACQTVNEFMRIIIRKHFMTCYHLLFGIEIVFNKTKKRNIEMKENWYKPTK